ncbi:MULTISPECIES: hypothetical protein [unclassified Nocardioides]|uniref:hypothetical protein n=1 Tax=unclassified Nocardioides TaxID=2615069 RepID=UPI00361DB8B5
MNQALLYSMTAAERRLVAETTRDALRDLDEEELLALHARLRRARAKYVTMYRRNAAGSVVKRGGRGFSYPKNQRDRDKAEVFEAALSRVSKEVGAHAARAAAELKASRLAAARARGAGPGRSAAGHAPASQSAATARPRGVKKTTGGLKRDADTRAAGARRQAKRDARPLAVATDQEG